MGYRSFVLFLEKRSMARDLELLLLWVYHLFILSAFCAKAIFSFPGRMYPWECRQERQGEFDYENETHTGKSTAHYSICSVRSWAWPVGISRGGERIPLSICPH
jgi:hypothetical protein